MSKLATTFTWFGRAHGGTKKAVGILQAMSLALEGALGVIRGLIKLLEAVSPPPPAPAPTTEPKKTE